MKLGSIARAGLLIVGLSSGLSSKADSCYSWGGQEQLATLPNSSFKEISGIAASKKFPGRLYLVNDSGDGGRFYSYETATGNFQTIEIEDFKSFDIEAISVGPCGTDSCVFIGDVGNNGGKRRELIRIVGIKERATYPSIVTPVVHKKLYYPDQPQDAESLVATQNGEFYIFSKKFDGEIDWDGVGPSHIFKTTYSELKKPDIGRLEDKGRLHPDHFTLPNNVFTITDAALSPDESAVMFMTYMQGAEMSWPELVSKMGDATTDIYMKYASLQTIWGVQSEAVTYLSNNSVVWTYETADTDPPLLLRNCNR